MQAVPSDESVMVCVCVCLFDHPLASAACSPLSKPPLLPPLLLVAAATATAAAKAAFGGVISMKRPRD